MITPVTVLTGFLGSGKTTLLAAIVRDPRFADTAIVVNEWGEAPIDHALLRHASGEVVVLAGGCVCCRAAGDIVRALRELHFERAGGRAPPFRRVVIETTGLADPLPLLATLVEMPLVAARYALAGVVATVDAERGSQNLDEHPEALRQVAVADRVVITKCDRVGAAVIDPLEARLRSLAPAAHILRSSQGNADPAQLLDTGLYRGDRPAAADARGWLEAGAYRRAGSASQRRHDPRITSFAWSTTEPLSWAGVEQALETLARTQGVRLLRMKGLVNVAGEPGPRAVHAAGHTLYPSARLAAWPDEDRSTRLVFIGSDLEDAAITQIFESILP